MTFEFEKPVHLKSLWGNDTLLPFKVDGIKFEVMYRSTSQFLDLHYNNKEVAMIRCYGYPHFLGDIHNSIEKNFNDDSFVIEVFNKIKNGVYATLNEKFCGKLLSDTNWE